MVDFIFVLEDYPIDYQRYYVGYKNKMYILGYNPKVSQNHWVGYGLPEDLKHMVINLVLNCENIKPILDHLGHRSLSDPETYFVLEKAYKKQ